MTSLLSTGSSALLAFQRALGTVSNNVANATTEGYSRQRVSLAARVGNNIAAGVGNSGQGVDVAALQRLADGLVFARQVDSSGEVGRLTSLSSMAGRVDTLLSDSSTGLSTPMSAFFDAARGVSSDPTSTSAREALLAAARSLAGRFNSLDGQLSTIDDETNQNLSDKVGQANQLAKEIADLNKTIASSGANASSELLDARDLRVTKLAGLIGATTVQQTDGSLSVFTTGGQPLVIGAKASTLTALQDPDQPGRLQVGLDAGNGTPVRLPDASISGELGGLLQFRTNVLDPARNELGRLATGVALAFNQAQANGVDYNGQIGADLFKLAAPAVASNAANTGSASFAVTVGDVSQLTGSDIVLRYSGSGWTAQRADTGATVADERRRLGRQPVRRARCLAGAVRRGHGRRQVHRAPDHRRGRQPDGGDERPDRHRRGRRHQRQRRHQQPGQGLGGEHGGDQRQCLRLLQRRPDRIHRRHHLHHQRWQSADL
ncbi:flagellar hook-associated protein FlgK [Pseudoxanthomonas sp. SORGH_AS_0997]|uniref:flagellar hook-associated protein FlgK n=1 Tax=Pseudoxanthomonas sp. SORGH_AS_0997 TaxID=3041776 RepID=UPI002855CFAC|nr:flagellar hook-associated protein FlgK [Pseudoxanthomonas sp. SORGH_AS_0997]MDR6140408.1 flagellar hook-associated protein FlgK [Pseudoxanthomonas sp. SORGH_AS_0997]